MSASRLGPKRSVSRSKTPAPGFDMIGFRVVFIMGFRRAYAIGKIKWKNRVGGYSKTKDDVSIPGY